MNVDKGAIVFALGLLSIVRHRTYQTLLVFFHFSARDFNCIVENILRNVSRGVFPGDYLTAIFKNQSAQSAAKRIATERLHSMGVPECPYIMKRSGGSRFESLLQDDLELYDFILCHFWTHCSRLINHVT